LWLIAAAAFVPCLCWPEALYARRIYPRLAALVGGPTEAYHGLLGWLGVQGPSLAELLVLAAAAWVLSRAWRPSGAWLKARAVAIALGRLVGYGLLAFLALWGLNHGRRPLLESLGWKLETVDARRLEAVARGLIQVMATSRAELDEDRSGVVEAPSDYGARAAAAWRRAASARPLLQGPEGRVVEPLASPLLIAARVSGIFSPFTGEAHVARGQPPIARGATACHELAHRRGFAREDEANGLAFLVGFESGDPYLTYSAAALGFQHIMGQLAHEDPGAWVALALEIPPPVMVDLEDQRRFWTRERTRAVRSFGRIAEATNDLYLRSMGSADGVRSYGRMVDLVLAYWDRRNEPVR